MTIFRLWTHEALRVLHDRLISFDDRDKFKKFLSDQCEQTLGTNMKECTNEEYEDSISGISFKNSIKMGNCCDFLDIFLIFIL